MTEELVVNCFDMDGTLYQLKGGSFKESPLSQDLQKLVREFIKNEITGSKISENEFWKEVEQKYGEDISLAVEDLLDIPRKEYFERTWGQLDPENYIATSYSYETLFENFKDEKNVLVTSAPEIWTKKVLKILELEKYFSLIRTGDPEPRKPDPQAFKKPICKSVGKENLGKIFFIGDQAKDFPENDLNWDNTEIVKVYLGERKGLTVNPDYIIENIERLSKVKNSS